MQTGARAIVGEFSQQFIAPGIENSSLHQTDQLAVAQNFYLQSTNPALWQRSDLCL